MAGLDPRPSGVETSDTLAAVLQDQAERQSRRKGRGRPPRDLGPVMALVAVVLAVLTVWLWLAPPDAIQPEPIPAPTGDAVEAGLRMDIYAAVLQVRDFEAANEGLPRTLEEALAEPEFAEGLTYTIHPRGVFEISGARGEVLVVYRSTERLDGFVAEARAQVRY